MSKKKKPGCGSEGREGLSRQRNPESKRLRG